MSNVQSRASSNRAFCSLAKLLYFLVTFDPELPPFWDPLLEREDDLEDENFKDELLKNDDDDELGLTLLLLLPPLAVFFSEKLLGRGNFEEELFCEKLLGNALVLELEDDVGGDDEYWSFHDSSMNH
ncbi:hypothetical protein CDL15_Pgr010421 [Punica granatum]|uniref:Uncharacterized protein n=1 Tax=Punica granatum TaxID=22663 RepID=A0A218W2L5_PUNGR|nr:hypothetical protein CDL15_Pgr010421 [Punica granatum]PKI48686.1 hypothetical protein CRG98_030903 [Punica granatum]